MERHVAELARGLAAEGIDVEVAVTDPPSGSPSEEIHVVGLHNDVRVHRFPTLLRDGVFFLSPQLVAWLGSNARRFELVHAHSYHTPLALAALVAARSAGRRFALTPHYHGTGHSPLRRLLHLPYRLPGRLMVRHARPLICVSHAERALLQRHFGDDLAVSIAPNGVDVSAIRAAEATPLLGERRLLLTAGRLESYKGVQRVVDALSCLPQEYELVVAGDGPERAALERQAVTFGVADRTTFAGHVPTADLRRLMRSADVFVSLSRHEAFGMSVLESAVAGCGVVASDIEAHRELASFLPDGAIEYLPVDAPSVQIATAIRGASRRGWMEADLTAVPTWQHTVEATLSAYGGRVP